jgi:transketolase
MISVTIFNNAEKQRYGRMRAKKMAETREELIERLKSRSREMRKLIIKTSENAGEGHIAPALSSVDITAALYFHILGLDSQNPQWDDRDRFLLSAGHKCLVQYTALAMRGFIPLELLDTFDQLDSSLGGHPIFGTCPGIEASTGSLGHGLSIGVGMAIAGKIDKRAYRVFVVVGDGECDEGSIWEGAMAAAKFKLDNLVAIVDYNKLSIDGPVADVMPLEPFSDKWRSFGWSCREIDGHNMEQIVDTLEAVPFERGKASVIIAHTVKGKGVSFMENNLAWHARAPSREEAKRAIEDIEAMF